MSAIDERANRTIRAQMLLRRAIAAVKNAAPMTLTDADVFEMWGLCPSSEREVALDALLTIASELGKYIDREVTVDVAIGMAFEAARAALEHDKGEPKP